MLKILCAVGLSALLLAAPAQAAPTMAAHTAAVVFSPKSMLVTAHERGYCWVSSIASQRPDAYRCMVGNAIHDPCFELTQHDVACPTDAAENRGIEISLTKPLPPQHRTALRNVWQMQLVSGAACTIATGTEVPGFPFYCTGGLVCSAPPGGQPQGALFVKCGKEAEGKVATPGSYLVRIAYE